jgi:hypothetical protein
VALPAVCFLKSKLGLLHACTSEGAGIESNGLSAPAPAADIAGPFVPVLVLVLSCSSDPDTSNVWASGMCSLTPSHDRVMTWLPGPPEGAAAVPAGIAGSALLVSTRRTPSLGQDTAMLNTAQAMVKAGQCWLGVHGFLYPHLSAALLRP